jgi:hypothetical protein
LPVKKGLTLCAVIAISLLLTSCSEENSTKDIRATLFLLDASKSVRAKVPIREDQLRNRLLSAFNRKEAIYFDFVRNDYSKQEPKALVTMQGIVKINDIVENQINNAKRKKQAREAIDQLWEMALSQEPGSLECPSRISKLLTDRTVIKVTEASSIGRQLCISATKANEILIGIKELANDEMAKSLFIGSNVEGAFEKGLKKLEADSSNIFNYENERVRVRATIVVSSDMMQTDANGIQLIDQIKDLDPKQIEKLVQAQRSIQERELPTLIIIDGWLTTSRNLSEKQRFLLESYWKAWFQTQGLEEPDFGHGVIDWSEAD